MASYFVYLLGIVMSNLSCELLGQDTSGGFNLKLTSTGHNICFHSFINTRLTKNVYCIHRLY